MRRRFSRGGVAFGVGILLAVIPMAAAQRAPEGGLPLSVPESEMPRSELLGLLEQVQQQIETIPADPTPVEAERLTSLNGLLQLLLLQTRLERLQRENDTLETQVAGDGAAAAPDGKVAALERRLDEVVREQQALAQEMMAFSADHASLLTSVVGTTEEPVPESQTHVVVEGDSLSRLAQTYLGDGSRWTEFLEVNPGLTNADSLTVGTELVIPPAD